MTYATSSWSRLIPQLLFATACWGAIGCAPIHCSSGEAIAFSEISKSAFGDSVSLVCADGGQYRPLLRPAGSRSFLFVNGLALSRPLLISVLESVRLQAQPETHLYFFELDRALLRPVPSLIGQQAHAALSPDASLIAYESTGDPSAPLRLVITDTQTAQNFLIPTAPNATDNLPTWSPDGKELMFIRLGYATGGNIPLTATLMTTSFPLGPPSPVFGPTDIVTSSDYSADGHRFAIWSPYGLEIVDRQTLNRTIILQTSSLAPRIPGTAGLIWGGSSGTLAFTFYNNQTSASELWTIREDGADARQVFSVTDGMLYVGSYVRQ